MTSLEQAEVLLHYSVQHPAESREAAELFTIKFEQACAEESRERIFEWLSDETVLVGLNVLHRLLTLPHDQVIKDTIGDAFAEVVREAELDR